MIIIMIIIMIIMIMIIIMIIRASMVKNNDAIDAQAQG